MILLSTVTINSVMAGVPPPDTDQWGAELIINENYGSPIALPDFDIDYVDSGTGEYSVRTYDEFEMTWTDTGILADGDTIRFHCTPNRYSTGADGEFYYPALSSDPIDVTSDDEDKITFSAGVNSVQISYPEYGYRSIAHIATAVVSTANGYDVWDNLIANDYRSCVIDKFILDETQALNFNSFINNHRGETITMELDTDSGFFPFGPDKGDSGVFTVKIVERKYGQFDQFNQFDKSIELLMITAPAYTPPDIVEQCDFQIGTIDGLMYPQTGISPNRTYGINTGVSYGGDGYSVDIKRNIHEVEFVQPCNESLAASLMDFLTGSFGRQNDITITAPTRYYLFDVAQGSSGTYTCKLIQTEIECTHIENEQFEIPLKFWMKSAA